MQSVQTSAADWWNESYFPELCSFVLPMEWIFTEILLVISLLTGFQFLGGMSNTMKTGVIASLLGILCSMLESRKSGSLVDILLKAMWKLCLSLILTTLKLELFVAPAGFPKKLCHVSPTLFNSGPRCKEILLVHLPNSNDGDTCNCFLNWILKCCF